MSTKNDGGFVCPNSRLTVRDYFAVRAPRKPWADYEPTMPSQIPEPDWGGISLEQQWDVDPVNWAERAEWKVEYRRQYVRQWPYFYADAMLAERAK